MPANRSFVMDSTWMLLVACLLAAPGADVVGAITAELKSVAGTPRVAAMGLDKSGTTGGLLATAKSQAPKYKELTNASSLQAERGGFEPPVRFDPHTAFPVPHNRPLCHLSRKLPLIYYNFIP